MQSAILGLVRRSVRGAGWAALVAAMVIAVVDVGYYEGRAAASTRPPTRRVDPGPVVAGSWYLALGDSVTFGYRESNSSPAPDYAKAESFVGYPEDVGAAFGLEVANAACPGETSSSFINAKALSNGCEHSGTTGPGYRSAYPLHLNYPGSQLDFAVKFLRTHQDTRLVSLMIGANDAIVCADTTKDDCLKELPGMFDALERNVTTILKAIRVQAGYRGQIVIVDYYSTDYRTALIDGAIQAVNLAQNRGAEAFHVEIANGYTAFEADSADSGGDACKAGLLTELTGRSAGTCGIHPSLAGQAVLALAVEESVEK